MTTELISTHPRGLPPPCEYSHHLETILARHDYARRLARADALAWRFICGLFLLLWLAFCVGGAK